ncbi:alpha/beta fold hydrolase [Nocardioides jiangxiensis]|uniref:Alpha/beta hydrolase n=1 Tax=Nocardioides jiangxiensis TaxID=3064524 RepID=A0ABT9B3B3_9ACTN|nr:alpha/beta hydrolase [Nocardioides sp. WY-20]MDO7868723.1 alpha/beta hydrolase [Nocardioides sp. WY-20]
MSWKTRAWAAAGAAGVAAAGTAVGVARHRHVIAARGAGEVARLGSLHSDPITVHATDGVALHVEIDPLPEGAGRRPRHRGRARGNQPRIEDLTVIFVHGFTLNLDSWHFQRAGYRGQVRTVYYDQRSHGRSGRSSRENSTIEHCAEDLVRVMDEVAPDGPVVLVGHSMGGMTIVALAEAHPELFGERVVGVGLVATTAGGLSPLHMIVPVIPEGFGADLAQRVIAGLARGSRVIEHMRRLSSSVALVVTDMFAFGDEVPAAYVEFVDAMISATPFEVLSEFFPNFEALDKFSALSALERVPTAIIGGTEDKLTSIGHSRKLAKAIAGSVLTECTGAGHMVLIERHEQVNAALDQLIAGALDPASWPATTAEAAVADEPGGIAGSAVEAP